MSSYKQKVTSNIGATYAKRFSNHFWTYRKGQLTTSNVKAMRGSSISATAVGSKTGSSRADDPENLYGETPVHSDLQPHALHTFAGDQHPSLVVAMPKSSAHVQNVVDCPRGSMMVGHTDPQIFHWFKQLGILPPRSIMSGTMSLLSGTEKTEAWEGTFTRHPVIHQLAEAMWMNDDSKTAEERAAIDERLRREDENRMRRMSSSDWRSKHAERTRDPTEKEDEEAPIYVLKEDTFALVRFAPEVRLWATMNSHMNRVYEPHFDPFEPIARCAPRLIQVLNANRQQLIPSLNINYNLKLTNGFVFELDELGFYLMGTEENFLDGRGERKENWFEFRLDYGKGITMRTEAELEWWIRGLTRLGSPEVGQTNADMQDPTAQTEAPFRHT